jgi:hypothetical protein
MRNPHVEDRHDGLDRYLADEIRRHRSLVVIQREGEA